MQADLETVKTICAINKINARSGPQLFQIAQAFSA